METPVQSFEIMQEGLVKLKSHVERCLNEINQNPIGWEQCNSGLKATYAILMTALILLCEFQPKAITDQEACFEMLTHEDAIPLLEEGNCMLAILTHRYPLLVAVCFLGWQEFNEAMYKLGFLQLNKYGPWNDGCFRVTCDNQLTSRKGEHGMELVYEAGSPMLYSPAQCGTVLAGCRFLIYCYALQWDPTGKKRLIACTEPASEKPYNANHANQFLNPDTEKQCNAEDNQCVITTCSDTPRLEFNEEGELETSLQHFVANMVIATSLMLHKGIRYPQDCDYGVNVFYGDLRGNWTAPKVTTSTPNNLQDWLIQNGKRPSGPGRNCYFLDLTDSMSPNFLDFLLAFDIPLQGANPESKVGFEQVYQATVGSTGLACVAWHSKDKTTDSTLQMIECTSPIQEGPPHIQSLELDTADSTQKMDVDEPPMLPPMLLPMLPKAGNAFCMDVVDNGFDIPTDICNGGLCKLDFVCHNCQAELYAD